VARPKYTEEDMRRLVDVSSPGSIPVVFLPGLGFSPKKFHEFLKSHGLEKDARYLFELPIGQVPPMYAQEPLHGYLKFRLAVGK